MSLRLKCVKVFEKILEEKVFFADLKKDFEPEDLPFANNLILTALRRKQAIDECLERFVTKKIKPKDKALKYVLELGATELLWLHTPDYAAINEYVNIAKRLVGQSVAGLVNAVLRKISLNKNSVADKISFPDSFKKILQQDYSTKQISQIKQSLLSLPPLDLSVKKEPEIWAEKLGGILFQNGTIRLSNPQTPVYMMEGFDQGAWWVQDLAASLPVCLLGDIKGKRVLDLCAAPGGKTAQLASKGAIVTAVDINKERLETLKVNMKRLGFEKDVDTVCADALTYLAQTSTTFDIILIDAPCSATGTFRRHPEVLHIKTLDDVLMQSEIQKKLLIAAALRVKISGSILFCTCSISKTEGEKQIEQFLKSNSNFEKVNLTGSSFPYLGQKLMETIFDKGVLRTLSYDMKDTGGMDCFFAACIKRCK